MSLHNLLWNHPRTLPCADSYAPVTHISEHIIGTSAFSIIPGFMYCDCCPHHHLHCFLCVTSHVDLQVMIINLTLYLLDCFDPLRAKLFRGNINIYLYFMSLLHIDMTHVLKILPRARPGPTYST